MTCRQSDNYTRQLPQPVALYLLSLSSSFRPWQHRNFRAASAQQYAANTTCNNLPLCCNLNTAAPKFPVTVPAAAYLLPDYQCYPITNATRLPMLPDYQCYLITNATRLVSLIWNEYQLAHIAGNHIHPVNVIANLSVWLSIWFVENLCVSALFYLPQFI